MSSHPSGYFTRLVFTFGISFSFPSNQQQNRSLMKLKRSWLREIERESARVFGRALELELRSYIFHWHRSSHQWTVHIKSGFNPPASIWTVRNNSLTISTKCSSSPNFAPGSPFSRALDLLSWRCSCRSTHQLARCPRRTELPTSTTVFPCQSLLFLLVILQSSSSFFQGMWGVCTLDRIIRWSHTAFAWPIILFFRMGFTTRWRFMWVWALILFIL